jgi:hypothetical protein
MVKQPHRTDRAGAALPSSCSRASPTQETYQGLAQAADWRPPASRGTRRPRFYTGKVTSSGGLPTWPSSLARGRRGSRSPDGCKPSTSAKCTTDSRRTRMDARHGLASPARVQRGPCSVTARTTSLDLGVFHDLSLVGADPGRAVERRRRQWPHHASGFVWQPII